MADIYRLKLVEPRTRHVAKTFILPWEYLAEKVRTETYDGYYKAEVEWLGEDGYGMMVNEDIREALSLIRATKSRLDLIAGAIDDRWDWMECRPKDQSLRTQYATMLEAQRHHIDIAMDLIDRALRGTEGHGQYESNENTEMNRMTYNVSEERILTIASSKDDDTDWIKVKLHGDGDFVTVRVPVRHPELQEAIGGCGVAKLRRYDVDDLAARILGHDDYHGMKALQWIYKQGLSQLESYLSDLENDLKEHLETMESRDARRIEIDLGYLREGLEKLRDAVG